MPVKKGKSKNTPLAYTEGQFSAGDQSYEKLIELCRQINGDKSTTPLETYSKTFSQAADHLSQEIDDFKTKIASIPLIAVIFVWAGFVGRDKVFGSRYVDMMRELILMDIIPCKNTEGKSLSIQKFNSLNFIEIIDSIRCNAKWLVEKREVFVNFFIEFITWLSDATFGYVSKIQDPDRLLSVRRQLPYETFVQIISALSLREKIIAKIFYLGGNRSSDDVISLKIEDIDYSACRLNLSGCWVSYPRHVLEDLKNYIDKRKKGFVFIGRDGDRTDSTVPYRALKTVISKLNLDPSFTFKDFGKNI